MISYLEGKIINKENNFVVILVNGIGYKVFAGELLFSEISLHNDAKLYIYESVKEDVHNLYGFRSNDELGLFELLLTVSGIGPKSAMGAMGASSAENIKEAILSGDSSLLSKASGIGKKTAERIVLELREKISKTIPAINKGEAGSKYAADEIDALVSLGYSLFDAREALKKVGPEIKKSEERVKEALKNIGNK